MTARRRAGREARTDWRVCMRLDAFTFVEANLHTGRTHQIRVHFSTLGCPVVGDTLYGAPGQERVHGELLAALDRNFLHAAYLAFAQPSTGNQIEAHAPLPGELVLYLKSLGQALGVNASIIDDNLKELL
jgi:23S rRNA pseudouridine1911/1915/1917 synthase